MKKIAILSAMLLVATSWGCGGENSAVDAAKDKVGDATQAVGDAAGDAAGNAVDAVGDAGSNAANAAGDLAEGAVNQLKAGWEKQFGEFDNQLVSLKTIAEKFNNPELNSYVETIGTKIGGAKEALTNALTGEGFDLGKIKEMMTTMVGEITGLFSAANDKAASLDS